MRTSTLPPFPALVLLEVLVLANAGAVEEEEEEEGSALPRVISPIGLFITVISTPREFMLTGLLDGDDKSEPLLLNLLKLRTKLLDLRFNAYPSSSLLLLLLPPPIS